MNHADIILYNGHIHTMEPRESVQQALAVSGNRIAAVGDDADILTWRRDKTELIDLRGRAVVPGMIDSHIHLGGCARRLGRIDLADAASLAEMQARIRARAVQTPAGEWLLGGGWNHNIWDLGRFPHREDVDAAAGDHPLALSSKDGHVTLANTIALQLAAVGRETPDPAGGEIARDPRTGEATGILKEHAQQLVAWLIPDEDLAQLVRLMRQATAIAHSLGLTGIHDHEDAEDLAALRELLRCSELGLRVYASLPAEDLETGLRIGLRSGVGSEWLRIGGLKIFADGALGSRTADMLEPYEDMPGYCGIEVTASTELAHLVKRAAGGGIHVCIHAIGDRANRRALDAIEADARTRRAPGLRHSIEHVQLLHPADVPRLAALGVVASMQPIHCTSDYQMADLYWGARSRYAYAWQSLLRSGAVLAFGSDAPVETMNPWLGVYAAVTRQRPEGDPVGGWYPEERLTMEQAIRAYTLGAAYASGEERIRGSLAPGKLADLVVLSHDVLSAPPDELLDAHVSITMLDGKLVYSAK